MPPKRESGSRKRQKATEANAEALTTTSTRFSNLPLPPGVSAVRLLWTDFAGIRRCRVIPASRWESVASGESPIRLARACAALQTTVDALTPGAAGAGVVGDVSLFPVTRPAALPWHPSHAVTLCELRKLPQPEEEGVLADSSGPEKGDDDDGGGALTPECFTLCARGTARRAALVAARSEPAMALRFGFETEFKLCQRQNPSSSSSSSFADPGNYCHSLTLDAYSAVLDEIVASLDLLLSRAGIEDVRVEQWHAEAGDFAGRRGSGGASSVFELVTSHAALVDAADALVLTRETISQVARRRGLDAVFLPKPDGASAAGLGCHAHFSVSDVGTGENLTRDVARKWRERTRTTTATAGDAANDDDKATTTAAAAAVSAGEAFVAGVCARVDALLAFTTSGPTSHLRLQPGCWSGAPSSSSSPSSNWGPANKEAPLRTLADNVEFKPMDATANPYLAAAALAAAGIAGVAKGEGLPPPRGGSAEEGEAMSAPAADADAAVAPKASSGGGEGSGAPAAPSAEAVAAEAACTKAVEALLRWKGEAGGGGLSPVFSPEALVSLVALRRADLRAMRDWSYEQTRERLSLLF